MTPLYDAAMTALDDFCRDGARETFAQIDAITDPEKRLETLITLIRGLEQSEVRLCNKRLQAELNAAVAMEFQGLRVPGLLGRRARCIVKRALAAGPKFHRAEDVRAKELPAE
jgi:hypothetical protein